MKISLSLPHADISPNSRKHWRAKAVKTKEHRARAKLVTQAGILDSVLMELPSTYSLAFFLPDKRKRDDDNLAAACKAYRDGIADALGIDDHNLRMDSAPTMQLDREDPRVEITLNTKKP